ncbi:hypothetical protein [Streptomyces sp. ODS28]|uniref:hypothetical protein n=1 Tax=Streptomyces sp. ODS28 TaxID=3136688 RepID=UPI0031ED4960
MVPRLLHPLFRLSILAFLLGGAAIVLGQSAGIVLGDARWVARAQSSVQPATCIAAGISGILAFALSYRRAEPPGPHAHDQHREHATAANTGGSADDANPAHSVSPVNPVNPVNAPNSAQ